MSRLLVIVLLVALAGASGALATTRPPSAEEAWRLLRSGQLDAAQAVFGALLAVRPGDVGALDGLGYVSLRRGNAGGAARLFAQALAAAPRDRDAGVGMALVEESRGERAAALARLDGVLRNYRGDQEAANIRARVATALGAPGAQGRSAAAVELVTERHPDPPRRPAAGDLPMRVEGRAFALRGADGAYRPVFLKAINLGVAMPGRFPSEFPTEESTYDAWFAGIKHTGFQAVRVYTILPPAFYDALGAWNREHPSDLLYLIHGTWAELPPRFDFSDRAYTEDLHAEVRRVVDLLHGALDLPVRPGHAGGRYRTDVSPWWIATILGREWEPFAVVAHDRLHPGRSSYQGRFVSGSDLTATERWLAGEIDYAVTYETERWNAQRPTAFTSWPTLDPLPHPTESTVAEEQVWEHQLGLPERRPGAEDYDDDAASVDMEKLLATKENHGGIFVSYHVYPYYPDFMVYDPGYLQAHDDEGPNPYLGYLRMLIAHHRNHPLFVAEVGVPSSREHAHLHPYGWTHGGHSEREQGEIDVRLMRSVWESGATGAACFEWIDEWFKQTWMTRVLHRPEERSRLWLDRRDPEKHFGLLGFRPQTVSVDGKAPRVVTVNGRDDDWHDVEPLLRTDDAATRVRSLSLQADAADLLLLVRLRPGPAPAMAIALDVIDPSLGDFRFPAGLHLESAVGFEAALLFDGARATVVLDRPFDPWSNQNGRAAPVANRDGVYVVPRVYTNRLRVGRDGTVFPAHEEARGELRGPGGTGGVADDSAEWAYDAVSGVFEARIPWGLLGVTDPSSRQVLFETATAPQGHRTTAGLHVAVVTFEVASGDAIVAAEGRALETLPRSGADGRIPSSPLFQWPTWEAPAFLQVEKASLAVLRDALPRIPDRPAEIDLP